MQRIYTPLIEKAWEKKKVVLLIGQRQVGKTYELNRFREKKNVVYIDFEDEARRRLFHTPSLDVLENIFGSPVLERYILLDEIQYLPKIGSILKLLHDHFPHSKILCTGSASFLLLKNIGDSLYGRNEVIKMGPLHFREMIEDFSPSLPALDGYKNLWNKPKVEALLASTLTYGSLPAVFLEKDLLEKQKLLENYISSLLFKDIFEIEGIRNPEIFRKCLQLLALQIGSEVNTNALSKILGISRNTVVEYIGLYEKFQIIYTLPAYAKNPRKEITKGKKIYFVDLGIRNALIKNFSDLDLRSDKGGLFENLIVNIFYGKTVNMERNHQLYFWRNYAHGEVDLLLEDGNKRLMPVEIKYRRQKLPTKSFMNAYKDDIIGAFCVNRENFWRFI
jgi:predicted AAA+ superfamily ATPase